MLPLPVSKAVLAGGAEWGSGACRSGVSCCRGGSSSVAALRDAGKELGGDLLIDAGVTMKACTDR